MRKIGYARVSRQDQRLDLQLAALEKYGCSIIYYEKRSGGDADRREFKKMLNNLKDGDIIVCWKLDRLNRNLLDFCLLINKLKPLNVSIVSIRDYINTGTPLGEAVSKVGAIFAEMERNNMSERTKAGLKIARQKGKRIGRPQGFTEKSRENLLRTEKMLLDGMTITEIANELNTSRTAIYRYLKAIGNVNKK